MTARTPDTTTAQQQSPITLLTESGVSPPTTREPAEGQQGLGFRLSERISFIN